MSHELTIVAEAVMLLGLVAGWLALCYGLGSLINRWRLRRAIRREIQSLQHGVSYRELNRYWTELARMGRKEN